MDTKISHCLDLPWTDWLLWSGFGPARVNEDRSSQWLRLVKANLVCWIANFDNRPRIVWGQLIHLGTQSESNFWQPKWKNTSRICKNPSKNELFFTEHLIIQSVGKTSKEEIYIHIGSLIQKCCCHLRYLLLIQCPHPPFFWTHSQSKVLACTRPRQWMTTFFSGNGGNLARVRTKDTTDLGRGMPHKSYVTGLN